MAAADGQGNKNVKINSTYIGIVSDLCACIQFSESKKTLETYPKYTQYTHNKHTINTR